MSTEEVVLNLQERSVIGKGLGSLRHEGVVPAVIHNHGQPSIHVMVPQLEMERVYHKAGKHHPLDLKVGDKKFLALIKDAQYNPVKRRLQHVVFQAIRQNEKTEAEVPIRLEGEIPAEKVGLMVLHQLDSVVVEAFPRDLPDELVVDAAKLAELHDRLTVADLKVPESVTVLTEPDHPIASVVETRAQMAEEAEEAAEEAAEEGQLPEQVAPGGQGETGNAPEGAEKAAAGQEAPKS